MITQAGMRAYKLVRRMKDGTLSSLFIGKKKRLPVAEWLQAECIPTEGFAIRPFWHCCSSPSAPHLSMKDRVWVEVEIDNYTILVRPITQGGIWYLAERMKIIRILS